MEELVNRGQRFHQLLERHFLGLHVNAGEITDANLRRWWSLFERSGLDTPVGVLLPEITLTIPVGQHQLTGRFDLLVLTREDNDIFARLFDWKTGKISNETELTQDWQTRLYLAMVAEGGGALLPDGRKANEVSLNPDNISITYWTITDPEKSRTIHYNQSWHTQNWTEINTLISQIDHQPEGEIWLLTDDWSNCRYCEYQSFCGREEAGSPIHEVTEPEESQNKSDLQLEPELP